MQKYPCESAWVIQGRGAMYIKNKWTLKRGLRLTKPGRTMQIMHKRRTEKWVYRADRCDFCSDAVMMAAQAKAAHHILSQYWWMYIYSETSWWMELTFFMLPRNPCSPLLLFKEGWRDGGRETKRYALQEGLSPSSRRNRIKGNGVMEDTAARGGGGGGGEALGCTTPSVKTGGGVVQPGCVCFRTAWIGIMVLASKFYFILLTP